MTATLESLRSAGLLSPLDRHFARSVGAAFGEDRESVLVAAALASRFVGHGHVCLDLARVVERGLVLDVDRSEAPPDPPALPALAEWLACLGASPLVTSGQADTDALRPLVLDGAGRLYLRRYWDLQQRLAAALLDRASRPFEPEAEDTAGMDAGLGRLFTNGAVDASGRDRQREAATCALRQRLCVITGGPGTGKTWTVAKILALIVEAADASGGRAPRIHLVAPTGKAAARLTSSIRAAVAGLDVGAAVRAALDLEATTVHRCLGLRSGQRPRFDAKEPLPTDLLLVDEASMVDLAMMTRLVEACPLDARLVLLGDADQLASVEAGAVLGDICDVERGASSAGAATSPLARCLVELTVSHRYQADSGIKALADAVRAGDAARALQVLDDPALPDVTLVPHARGQGEALRADAMSGYAPFLQADSTQAKIAALDGYRVLCAHRTGPDGVAALNLGIEARLARTRALRPTQGDYDGRPILVTRNDPELGIYNGDIGLIAQGEDGRLRAWFDDGSGGLRAVSHLRLAGHETVFAMSVHKSQGSEFDRVAVVLPETASAILSRELVYTAISRARTAVSIHASREVLRAAIEERVERASGLRDLLWS